MEQELEDQGADRHVFSNMVRAGQRTYFFDIKVNRNNHHYLVITESKKRIDQNGKSIFDKFKIHLYHESIVAFSEILNEMTEFLLAKNSQQPIDKQTNRPTMEL